MHVEPTRFDRTMRCMREPCASCPARKGVAAASMPGGFDVDHARRALALGSLASGFGPLMVCHHTPEDTEARALCFGWLYLQRRAGLPNLKLRMHLLARTVQVPQGDRPDLVASFEEMIAQMEADPDATR